MGIIQFFLSSFKESTIKEKADEENSNSFFELNKMINSQFKYCNKILDEEVIEVNYPQNENIKLYYCIKCFNEHILSKLIYQEFKKRTFQNQKNAAMNIKQK